ncbi:Crp/Fnr family transcriptional regulator [Methylobacterium sp. J-026]|uniref:Crp/Fnr family transcriptional regulator n=1 Tax=Methylobacterium sp. J-026 TaxID=2836624 RepID=UPI001FB8B7AD|nr:Crp/Fnr family transcriptional regulator [Methylobacterium sp. J-026]MCJ2132704.1 Crp/Fnr family transcriptional regulator [Methylobacterium sp. J-026]
MSNPLIMKLEYGARLTDEDRVVLHDLTRRTRRVARRMDISPEGERPENVHLVVEGFACRYKTLTDGRRQITAFLVPGDFCDLHVAILGEMDHSIGTSWGCTIVDIPRSVIMHLTAHHPRITRALWWATLVDEGTLRAWLVNMGQHEANRQMAHLVCELLVRLRVVGLVSEDSFEFPMTQDDLADALGITGVHVNRVLQDLRGQGLLEWKSKRLRIPNASRLMDFAEFDPKYLHLNPRDDDERSLSGTS